MMQSVPLTLSLLTFLLSIPRRLYASYPFMVKEYDPIADGLTLHFEYTQGNNNFIDITRMVK
jgi:hypothetical protein